MTYDLKKTNSSDKIFVFADKTRNIYETSLDTYNKLLHDNITKTYKHGSEDNISEINNELKHIANKLSIGNRKISKLTLDKVNTNLRTILNVNQLRNTQNVIE